MTKRSDEDRIPATVFAITVTGAFMVALDLSIVNIAFPSIERSFAGVSTTTLSWVLSSYSVVFGALLLGAGRIVDRSGRKRSFLAGLAVFTIGSAACAVAPAAALLIAGRVVQAVGAALLMPASLALLLAATPATQRARAVAMWGGISALAVATGPSLGSALVDAGGWRWAFIVNLPVALAAALVARGKLAESKTGGKVPDLVGVGLFTLAVASVALGITEGSAWGWSSWRVLCALASAVVLAPMAVQRSLRHPAPAIDLGVFRSRTVALANAGTLLYAIGFFAMLLGNVLFLTRVWHYSTLRAGLAITPGPLVVAALSSTTGRWATRYGYRPVLVSGSLLFALGELLLVLRVHTTPSYLLDWAPSALLVGLGVALSFPVLSAAAVSGLPPEKFGVGGAINQTSRQLGAVLGVALLVAIIGTPESAEAALQAFRHAWVLCVIVSVACAVLALGHVRAAVVSTPVPIAGAASRP
ncbi:MAG TPA: MFS transporter [Acidimicrobiales bacterium]|nr:MFS transporter [Acidimicrobiales bacterium]